MDKYEKIKLENQLCFSLYAASREVIKIYKPLLDKYGLTYTQYIAMLVVWEHEKITVKEMGKKLHLDSRINGNTRIELYKQIILKNKNNIKKVCGDTLLEKYPNINNIIS